MSKKPDLEQKDEFSDTWTASCRDPNCGHPRYAHSGQLGDNPCKIGDCPCPWFIDFNPTGVRVGFYDSPRFWVDSADEYDPAWYQKLGVPSFGGADEWGRLIVTVRIPFVGYLHWAYRTCWCQDCHAMREQTYKYQREEWDHVTERANQDLLWTKDHRHMFLGGTS